MKEVPSTWSVTKAIVAKDGLGFRGLNKGVTATIGRNGVFNMVYFGFYHSVKGFSPEFEVNQLLVSLVKIKTDFSMPVRSIRRAYQMHSLEFGVDFKNVWIIFSVTKVNR